VDYINKRLPFNWRSKSWITPLDTFSFTCDILYNVGPKKSDNPGDIHKNFCHLPCCSCDSRLGSVHWVKISIAQKCQMARSFYVHLGRFWRDDSLFIWRFMGFFVNVWPAGQHECRTFCWDVERVCPRRFPMGLCGRDNSISRNFDSPWSWSDMLLYIEAAHQRRPRSALLDCDSEHSGIIWRMDDFLSRVAHWKRKSRYLESSISLGLSIFHEHNMGHHSALAYVRLLRPHRQLDSLCTGKREGQKELNQIIDRMTPYPTELWIFVPTSGIAWI